MSLRIGLRVEIKGKRREGREGKGGEGEGKRRGKENNSTGKKSHSETLLKILLINSAIPSLGINTKLLKTHTVLKNVLEHIHSSSIHNSQRWKQARC